MRVVSPKKSESKAVQKEHVRRIASGGRFLPVLINKGVRGRVLPARRIISLPRPVIERPVSLPVPGFKLKPLSPDRRLITAVNDWDSFVKYFSGKRPVFYDVFLTAYLEEKIKPSYDKLMKAYNGGFVTDADAERFLRTLGLLVGDSAKVFNVPSLPRDELPFTTNTLNSVEKDVLRNLISSYPPTNPNVWKQWREKVNNPVLKQAIDTLTADVRANRAIFYTMDLWNDLLNLAKEAGLVEGAA